MKSRSPLSLGDRSPEDRGANSSLNCVSSPRLSSRVATFKQEDRVLIPLHWVPR